MSLNEYLDGMTQIQENLIDYIDDDDDENDNENFKKLNNIFSKMKIQDDHHKFISFLHFLMKFSKNHHRGPRFFDKIEQILLLFKENIKKQFTNLEIFNIFKSNKRILLFFIEQKMLIIDKCIVKKMFTKKYENAKYITYFQPEIKLLLIQNRSHIINPNLRIMNQEIPEFFYENRKYGENVSYICKLIQNDSVEEFITHINRNNYSLNSKICPSDFETNALLLKNQENLTLIKYAMFYGAIQIIQYLKMNYVELTPELWIFAIHSQNAEIIHLLEENHVEPIINNKKSYKLCFEESIKCHHNNIANYIQDNLLSNEDINPHDSFLYSLKYHNFSLIPKRLKNEKMLTLSCLYGHNQIVNILLNSQNFDINKISFKIFNEILY